MRGMSTLSLDFLVICFSSRLDFCTSMLSDKSAKLKLARRCSDESFGTLFLRLGVLEIRCQAGLVRLYP